MRFLPFLLLFLGAQSLNAQIKDSTKTSAELQAERANKAERLANVSAQIAALTAETKTLESVSYTHLTLPTILLV